MNLQPSLVGHETFHRGVAETQQKKKLPAIGLLRPENLPKALASSCYT